MARHRHVRGIKEDDLEHQDDIYGHSMEDDYCVSPDTAAQYIFNPLRGDAHTFAAFLKQPPTQEFDFSTDDFPDEPDDTAVGGASAMVGRSQRRAEPTRIPPRPAPVLQPPPKKERVPPHPIVDPMEELSQELLAAATVEPPALNGQLHKNTLLSEGTGSKPNSRCASPAPPALAPTDRSHLLKEYETRRQELKEKETLNLIVIGHVDAGKSTLMGNVLCQLGFVSDKQLQRYRWDAQKLGKASFAYAWVLDQTSEERSRGVTMDISETAFETENKRILLLDAPGHKDFIPNMIMGAVQADVALLVVNATRGEFETGFESGGQTREHALLVRSLGVTQLVVAVNKMDTVGWAEDRFREISTRLTSFLKTVNFGSGNVTFCPVSGLLGVNLARRGQPGDVEGVDAFLQWYEGPCLVECLDKLTAPSRPVDLPFRFSVSDVYKPAGSGVPVVNGRVEAGGIASSAAVSAGQAMRKVLCMPAALSAQVKAIRMMSSRQEDTGGDDFVPYAFAGDHVSLALSGVDVAVLGAGSILCDPGHPVPCTNHLQARLLVFNISTPIMRSSQVVFHYQCLNVMATIRRLVSCTFKEGKQEQVKKNPRCLTKNCTAEVVLLLEKSVCIEVYQDFKALGKFTLRYQGQTIAGGTVTAILPQKNPKSAIM